MPTLSDMLYAVEAGSQLTATNELGEHACIRRNGSMYIFSYHKQREGKAYRLLMGDIGFVQTSLLEFASLNRWEIIPEDPE